MNLQAMDLISLRVLLSCTPPSTSNYDELIAEIKRKETSERWKKAHDKYIQLNLN